MTTETGSQPSTDFRLVVLGDGSVRTVPLVGSRWVLGRSPDCCIPLRDPTVSRRHLAIERQGDTFRFQDLGGSNPVLVDGRPCHTGILCVGQTLLVGLTRLLLEQRRRPSVVIGPSTGTVMLSREVIDDEAPAATAPTSTASIARRVLERIEWTFADLGGLADVAEPLLELAANLTGRRRGLLGRFSPQGSLETLATIDSFASGTELHLPETVLNEARRLGRANLLTTEEQGQTITRLVVPLGPGPDGLLVLESPLPDAVHGQELLRLGRTLGVVAWHRLQETRERLRLRDEVQRLRFHGTTSHNALLTSSRLQPLRELLRELANQDAPVWLAGEDGTEREDLARYLHFEGQRARGPFLAIDLGPLPEWRREKELLGDGKEARPAVRRAAGGTLFLDHVETLAPALQERLAEHYLGLSLDAPEPMDRRPRLVLGSTPDRGEPAANWHPSLRRLLDEAPLLVPTLRSDPRDVLALAELYLSELGSAPDGSPRLLSERSKRLLVAHDWPGNVRELRQVLEQAASRAGSQPIAPRHLPDSFTETPEPVATAPISTLEEVEQRHVRDVLLRCGGNRAKAAQALGIAASTLYEKLKRYAIE